MRTLTPRRTGDLLRIADLEADELNLLLDRAAAMKADHRGWLGAMPGASVACYFAKPSTRTRVSFETGVYELGGNALILRQGELQMARGESPRDVALVLSRMVHAVGIRTFAQSDVEEMASAASVPVINALTDDHHPCQALADLLTLRERFGRLEGLRVAYVGDGNNVAHSLMEAAAVTGFELSLACPPGYLPDADIARAAGPAVHMLRDPRDAVVGAHAVYTDVWVSMGDEAERSRRMTDLDAYRVDSELMALAAREAIFLHCLPAHRGEEVAADVIDGPRSAVWEQAANRLATEQAVLHALVTGWEG